MLPTEKAQLLTVLNADYQKETAKKIATKPKISRKQQVLEIAHQINAATPARYKKV